MPSANLKGYAILDIKIKMTRSGRVKTVIYMAKKVNTRQKGRRNELRAAKILEDAGYDVQLTPTQLSGALKTICSGYGI